MQYKKRNVADYVKGLAVCLLFPLIVLLGLSVYVYVANSTYQTGPLHTNVHHPVLFAGQQTVFDIIFKKPPEAKKAPPPPIDIIFAIDVSGSMTNSLPDMSNAARSVATEMSKGDPGFVNFALIQFDSEVRTLKDWTADPEVLYQGLQELKIMTGQNDSRAAFAEINNVLSKGRPNSRKVIVFYTDGNLDACDCPAMSWDEMESSAVKLRSNKTEIYSIGLPGNGSNPEMIRLTASSANIFEPFAIGDLTQNFRVA